MLEALPETNEAEQDNSASEASSRYTMQACCPPSDAQELSDFQSTEKDHPNKDNGTESLLGVCNTAEAAGQRGSRPPTPSSEALADTGDGLSADGCLREHIWPFYCWIPLLFTRHK